VVGVDARLRPGGGGSRAPVSRDVRDGDHVDVAALPVTGSVAFRLRVGDRVRLPRPPLQDIDLVAPSGTERRTARVLTDLGYSGEKEFNARHGASRLVFWDRARERKLEVFLGTLVMCHTLPLSERLAIEAETIPMAEMLLTKLQIVQLNEKDVTDMLSLLIAYDVGASDTDQINAERIAELCARDWGLHHTVDRTLGRLAADPPSYELSPGQRSAVDERMFVSFFSLDAFTSRSSLRAFSPTTMPS